MKKIGTLALTLALAGSMTVPALAAEETAVPISADTGYGTALVLNGETLDLTGIPGVEGGTLLPLRLLAEAEALHLNLHLNALYRQKHGVDPPPVEMRPYRADPDGTPR